MYFAIQIIRHKVNYTNIYLYYLCCTCDLFHEKYGKYDKNICFKPDISISEIQCTGCGQEMENCRCQMIVYMFHETNRKLIELELLERLVGNVLTSLIHIRIKNHVIQTCDKTFDVSQLISLENVC